MPLEDFIIWEYVLVDDWLADFPHPVRQHGFAPAFSDAEVIPLEVVGEYLGYDEDKAGWAYFNRHWREWFPRLPSRSTYVRQCAHLWAVKPCLHAHLWRQLGVIDSTVHRVDGFPMPLCNFRRAPRCRLFQGEAAYGHCASKNMTYYGFQSVLVVSRAGWTQGGDVIAQLTERFHIQKIRARDRSHLAVRITRKVLKGTSIN